MVYSLENKTILITGATDGLGKKLALKLATYKANIIIHGRNQDKLNEVLQQLQAINNTSTYSAINCDLNNSKIVQGEFAQINQLDILINNAGVWLEGDTVNATAPTIDELINVNLRAPLLITNQLLPVLKKSNFSQILNVVSIAGVEIPSGYFHTIYSATKFGLQAFSEALAKEFDNQHLRVMGYYPGGMETNLFKKSGSNYQTHESWMFDPQESVEAIIFMLTRDPKINLKRLDLINHLQQ